MYYAYMSLRVLLHYGTEILPKYTYIYFKFIYILFIINISIAFNYTSDLMSLIGFYSRQPSEYLVAFDGIIFDYF